MANEVIDSKKKNENKNVDRLNCKAQNALRK